MMTIVTIAMNGSQNVKAIIACAANDNIMARSTNGIKYTHIRIVTSH
jgi:hypothetical protein